MAVALVNTTRRAGAARLINIRGSSEQAVRSEKGCRFIKKKGKKKKKESWYAKGPHPTLEKHTARLPLGGRVVFLWTPVAPMWLCGDEAATGSDQCQFEEGNQWLFANYREATPTLESHSY